MGNPEKQAEKPGKCGSTDDPVERPGAQFATAGLGSQLGYFPVSFQGKTLMTSHDTLL